MPDDDTETDDLLTLRLRQVGAALGVLYLAVAIAILVDESWDTAMFDDLRGRYEAWKAKRAAEDQFAVEARRVLFEAYKTVKEAA